MAEENVRTWMEVVSNSSSEVAFYLVISIGRQQFRYEIPGVVEATWLYERRSPRTLARESKLTLTLENVLTKTQVAIDSDAAKVEDLIAEIVAGYLIRDGVDDGGASRFLGHANHCDLITAPREALTSAHCTCDLDAILAEEG